MEISEHNDPICGRSARAAHRSDDLNAVQWTVAVYARGNGSVILLVDMPGDGNVSLQHDTEEALVARWALMRGCVYTRGPLAQEVFDAIVACRAVLDQHGGASTLERFAKCVRAGVEPDEAAQAIGCTGRPENAA